MSKKNKKKKTASQSNLITNEVNTKEDSLINECTAEERTTSSEDIAVDVSSGTANDFEADAVSDTENEINSEINDDIRNEFERSLAEFSSEDACVEKSRPKQKRLAVFRIMIFAICVAVCAVCIVTLVQNLYGKYKSDLIYSELSNKFSGDSFNIDGSSDISQDGSLVTLLAPDKQIPYTPTMEDIIANGISDNIVSKKSYTEELLKMRAALSSLASINSEIYGWIKVPGTRIDYPIAQADNNEYYLDRAYTGDNLVTGSIFADFRCSASVVENYNTVLYGHNVSSGQMFHDVEAFFTPDVFENTNIYLYTFDGIYIYKPFSVHEASYDSGYIDTYFESGEGFMAFAEDLRALSDIGSDAEITPDSRILTLSTCTNGIATRRYALHAVLIETITD